MALIELGVAVLADKRRQGRVLVHSDTQQTLKVPNEDTLPWGQSLGGLPRHSVGDTAEAPRGELPVAEATVPHGKSPACS